MMCAFHCFSFLLWLAQGARIGRGRRALAEGLWKLESSSASEAPDASTSGLLTWISEIDQKGDEKLLQIARDTNTKLEELQTGQQKTEELLQHSELLSRYEKGFVKKAIDMNAQLAKRIAEIELKIKELQVAPPENDLVRHFFSWFDFPGRDKKTEPSVNETSIEKDLLAAKDRNNFVRRFLKLIQFHQKGRKAHNQKIRRSLRENRAAAQHGIDSLHEIITALTDPQAQHLHRSIEQAKELFAVRNITHEDIDRFMQQVVQEQQKLEKRVLDEEEYRFRGLDLEDFAGEEHGDSEPCPLPRNVLRGGKGLQGHTPYGGNAAHLPIRVLHNLTLKGVYVVARHCTRLPSPEYIDKLVKFSSGISSFLLDDIAIALREKAAAHRKWKDWFLPVKEGTASVCTKCGFKEQMLLGKRFGRFLKDALRISNITASPQHRALAVFDAPEYTHVERTRQSQHAFFKGMQTQLRACLDRKKDQFCGVYVPKREVEPPSCNKEDDRELLRYALSRPHKICRSFIDYLARVKPRKGKILITNATKSALLKMFKPETYLATGGLSKRRKNKIFEKAAYVAMTMCEDYVARGSAGAIDWCNFLDKHYIRRWSTAGEKRNAIKQGPASTSAYKHLGVLALHLVVFGLRALFGIKPADWDHQYFKQGSQKKNHLKVRVRIMHAHVETLLPLLSLLRIVRSGNFANHKQGQFSSNLRLEYYQSSIHKQAESEYFVRVLLNEQAISLDPLIIEDAPQDSLMRWEDFRNYINAATKAVGYTGPVEDPNTCGVTRAGFDSVCREGAAQEEAKLLGIVNCPTPVYDLRRRR